MSNIYKKIIPVFFSCDDNYLPYLAVAIRSLIDNAHSDAEYRLFVLHNGLDKKKTEKIKKMATPRVSITFTDVSKKIEPLMHRLKLRDYYTVSIYFRLFIPALFPEYDKAIYLDADIVVLSDIAGMYETELGGYLLGVVPDAIIASRDEFIAYSECAVGVPYRKYFNSGVLLMNLALLRENDVEGHFAHLLRTYGFNTICPDQDYLNVICRDRVMYLDGGWNKMSIDRSYPGTPSLVHFNMFNKPWHYNDVAYEEYFWEYAKKTEFIDDINEERRSFGLAGRIKDGIAGKELLERALAITTEENNFKNVLFGKDEIFNENEENTATVAG